MYSHILLYPPLYQHCSLLGGIRARFLRSSQILEDEYKTTYIHNTRTMNRFDISKDEPFCHEKGEDELVHTVDDNLIPRKRSVYVCENSAHLVQ